MTAREKNANNAKSCTNKFARLELQLLVYV